MRLTPRSSRDAIDGVETDAAGRAYLKARVRAVPEDGAANTALCILVAKALGVPKSAVSIVSGSASRLKTVRIEGEAQALQAALGQVIAGSG